MEALVIWCSNSAAQLETELRWDMQRDIMQASWCHEGCLLIATAVSGTYGGACHT